MVKEENSQAQEIDAAPQGPRAPAPGSTRPAEGGLYIAHREGVLENQKELGLLSVWALRASSLSAFYSPFSLMGLLSISPQHIHIYSQPWLDRSTWTSHGVWSAPLLLTPCPAGVGSQGHRSS